MLHLINVDYIYNYNTSRQEKARFGARRNKQNMSWVLYEEMQKNVVLVQKMVL